ncbi:MAG: MFS transporter [Dehalococcoidia bacterium]
MPALTSEDRRTYQANVWKLYFFHFLMNFQLWWSIWVIYLQDLRGFSLTQVTILEAVFWVTAVVAEVPTGAIADRHGRKVSLVLGASCITLAVFVFGMATTYPVILLSYGAWGFGVAFLSGAEHALLFESLKELGRERDFQASAGRLAALFSLGALAGGLAGAPIAAATDLSTPVLLSAAIAAPAVFVALTMREPPLPEGGVRPGYGALLFESAATALRLPAVRTMLLLSSLVTACTFGPILFMQPFLTGHDVELRLIGFLVTPAQVTAIIGALVAYRVTTVMGPRGAFIIAPAILLGSYLLLGTWDAVFAFAAFPILAFINNLLMPTAENYLNQRIPSSHRATILSLRTMLVSLWIALLVPSLGAIADSSSLPIAFLVTAGVASVTIPIALLLWLRADASGDQLVAVAET